MSKKETYKAGSVSQLVFGEGGLNQKLKYVYSKMSQLGGVLSKLVSLNRILGGDLGA